MTFNNINSKKIIRGILIYIAVTFLFGVPAALISGIWPKTVTGWILIIILAVPVMVIGSFIGEKLFSDKISDTIDPKRKNKQISPRRMYYQLLIGVIYVVLLLLVIHEFGDKIKTHFNFP
jgi:amino acid transporter